MSAADRLSPWPGWDPSRDTDTRKALVLLAEILSDGHKWHSRRITARTVARAQVVGVIAIQRLITGCIQMGTIEAGRGDRIRLATKLPSTTKTTSGD